MNNFSLPCFKILFLLCLFLPVSTPVGAQVLFSNVSAGILRFQLKMAEQGNAEAQYKVGEMYEIGKGVRKDAAIALLWFEKSAAQGHRQAGYKLLYLEIQSNGLNDFTQSQLGVLRQQAALGNSDAQYFLGKMYAAGVGVPKSLTNALTWLNKATFNGVTEAEHEAIAVEEELARIREKEAKKRSSALAAARFRKEEESKKLAAQKKADTKNSLFIANKRKTEEYEKKKRDAEQRRKMEEERKALADEKYRLVMERRAIAVEKEAIAKKKAQEAALVSNEPEVEKETSFESDPCKGKSARFLSTCR